MASPQVLKQRTRDEPATDSVPAAAAGGKSRRDRKVAMAKRGLRSLAVAVAVPLGLTVLSLQCASGAATAAERSRFWRWSLQLGSVSCSGLMGLAAWLVWAEGGFHRRPAALGLYAAQMALGMAWAWAALGAGVRGAAVGAGAALVGALVGCARSFGRVNPIAGDLVKPCVAWAVFLAIFSYKLV